MKREKHKNLREESGFYWQEISLGTYKFDRRESEVRISVRSTPKRLVKIKFLFIFWSYDIGTHSEYMNTQISFEDKVETLEKLLFANI